MILKTLQIAAATAVLLTAGCGADGSDANAADVDPSDTASATTSPSPVTEVSLETACDLLFESEGAPMEPLVDFIIGGESAPGITETEENLAEFEQIAERAPEELRGNLDALGAEIHSIIDTGTSSDMTAIKAAGLEITNQCEDVL